MNRIATKLPEGRRQAHRRRPIWLLLALLTLGPAVGLAQTYTTIDCPDSVSLSGHQRPGRDRRHLRRRQRGSRLSASERPLHVDRRPGRGGAQWPGPSTTGATSSAATMETASTTAICSAGAASRRSTRRAQSRPLPAASTTSGESSASTRDDDSSADFSAMRMDTGTSSSRTPKLGGLRHQRPQADRRRLLRRERRQPGVSPEEWDLHVDPSSGRHRRRSVRDQHPRPHRGRLERGSRMYRLPREGVPADASRVRKHRVSGALETVATGINVRGQIVGNYSGEDEVFHGFLRSDRGRLRRRLNRHSAWAGRSSPSVPPPLLPPVRARIREDEPALVGEVRVGVVPTVGRDGEPRTRYRPPNRRNPVMSGGASCFQRSRRPVARSRR